MQILYPVNIAIPSDEIACLIGELIDKLNPKKKNPADPAAVN